MNEQTYETGTEVKVYYPMDKELQEKADKFGVGRRKKYVTLENNPFGYKKGIFFTGAGLYEAMSKTRVNFMQLNSFDDVGSKKWRKMYDYIRTVSNAIAYDTVVSAKGHLKGGEMFETPYDVQSMTSAFYEFLYDEEKHQIYRYVIVE